jgi:hypothetical protein
MRGRAFSMLLAVVAVVNLGGCAMSGLLPNWLSEDVAGPEPKDYRFAVAVRLKDILGSDKPSDTLQLTIPRRVDALKGASWIVCMKAQKFPLLPRYYAIVFQRGQIVDSRLSVLIDQCELQSFSAFDWSAEMTPAAPRPLPQQ